MTEDVVLEVERISKRYRRLSLPFSWTSTIAGNLALDDVSLALRQGEVVGLLGANGAGKTTLLKIVTTMIHPSTGRVLLQGRDVSENQLWARSNMGLVTCDERSFYWRLSGRQNLHFFAELYGWNRRDVTERIEHLLETLGLLEAADRPYQNYSSGMKQKLAIARGWLGKPSIVFYDEPTRSLDPLSAQTVRGWIRRAHEMQADQTHVIATNQLSEAEQLCDRVFILARGKLITHGTIREIRQRYQMGRWDRHRISYRGAPLDGKLKPSPERGLMEVQQELAAPQQVQLSLCTVRGSEGLSIALDSILQSGGVVLACESHEASFDEVFCSLIAEADSAGRDRARAS